MHERSIYSSAQFCAITCQKKRKGEKFSIVYLPVGASFPPPLIEGMFYMTNICPYCRSTVLLDISDTNLFSYLQTIAEIGKVQAEVR